MNISRSTYDKVMRHWHGAENTISIYTDHGRGSLEPALADVRQGRDKMVARLLVLLDYYKGVTDGLVGPEGPSHYTIKGLASIQRGCRDAYCVGLTASAEWREQVELDLRKLGMDLRWQERREKFQSTVQEYLLNVQAKARWTKRLLDGGPVKLSAANMA